MILVAAMAVEAERAVPASAVAAMLAGQAGGCGLNGVDGKQDSQRGGGRAHASARQQLAELFQGASDALLGGVVAHADGRAHRTEVLVLIEAQDKDVVVRFAEFGHGVVEHGPQALPIGRGIGGRDELFHNLPFTRLAPELVAAEVEREVAGAAAQPAGEGGLGARRGNSDWTPRARPIKTFWAISAAMSGELTRRSAAEYTRFVCRWTNSVKPLSAPFSA